jgi:hypothetical protein
MKKSTALFIIAIFVLFLGLGFIFMGIISMGESPEAYDDWVSDPSRGSGDEITVTGKISDKTPLFGGSAGYSYKFEGSDEPFYSGENIGSKGDTVTVDIRISEIEGFKIPEAKKSFPLEVCWVPGIICIIIGIFLLIFGFRVKRKERSWVGPGYPPPGYPTPPQQPLQYPPPAPTQDRESIQSSPHYDYQNNIYSKR